MIDNNMNDKLLSDIRSIGATCFVQYLPLWMGDDSNTEAAKKLKRAEGYTENSCLSRVSKARNITRVPARLRKALVLISEMDLEKVGRPELPAVALTLSEGVL